MNPVEIVPYRIQQEGGTYALLLGTQLIMQASERADCERVKAGLEHRGHDKRNLVPADTKGNPITIQEWQ